MPVNLSPVGGAAGQFFDSNGNPLAGGKLYSYAAGTTTPETTYTSATGVTANPNPIILNSGGRVPSEIWLTENTEYKFTLETATGTLIGTWDNIEGINDPQTASEVPFVGFKGQTGFVSDLADNDGSDWVGFQPANSGVARSAQDKMRDMVSVKDFGAVGDGVTDDTTALQLALNNGGGIYVPNGIYLYSTLTMDVSKTTLVGAGRENSVLKCTTTTGTAFLMGNGSAQREDLYISSIGFDTQNTRTSGATIYTVNAFNVIIEDVQFQNTHDVAIWADGGAGQFLVRIENVDIFSASIGIGLGLTTALGQVQDVWISDCIIGSCTNAGIRINNASGVYASNIDVLNSSKGIAIEPESGAQAKALFLTTVLGDTCANGGFVISPPTGGSVVDVNMVSCWGATTTLATGAGLVIEPSGGNVSNIAIDAFRAVNNQGPGIKIIGGKNITLSNCHASANSQVTANTHDGLFIDSCFNFSVIGGVYGGDDDLPQQQRYGINIGSSAFDYSIIGAVVENNDTAGIKNDGATGNVIANIGYRTSEQNLVSVGAAQTSLVVTHNLSYTPNIWDIIVVPTTDLVTAGIITWWVSATTSTNFTISFNAATTGTAFFSFQINQSQF